MKKQAHLTAFQLCATTEFYKHPLKKITYHLLSKQLNSRI